MDWLIALAHLVIAFFLFRTAQQHQLTRLQWGLVLLTCLALVVMAFEIMTLWEPLVNLLVTLPPLVGSYLVLIVGAVAIYLVSRRPLAAAQSS